MDYLRLVIDIISVLVGYGAIGYAGVYLHKHHKANHLANGLELAQKFINISVARVATDSNLPMGMRKMAVMREVQEILDRKGHHFDLKRLDGMAQIAYNAYKANGNKIVKPEPTPAPTVDNTTDGPKGDIVAKNDGTAEYHPKNELSSDEINLLNDYRAKKAANK